VSFGFYGDGLPWGGTTVTQDTGNTLITADTGMGSGTEQIVESSSGTFNPAFTFFPDATVAVLTIALKAGSGGTAPGAGIRIVGIQDFTTALNLSSFVTQWPTNFGNLLLANWSGQGPDATTPTTITGITDTAGNTWTSRVTQAGNTTGCASSCTISTEQILDTGNATTITSQSNNITVTLANASSTTFQNQ